MKIFEVLKIILKGETFVKEMKRVENCSQVAF